ncbi:MAG TPA: hypothetical protein VMG10_12725 [Gemmataceae bacterium]|nr:hypothetical protein [Gemmataceae bacterium]
MSVAFHCLECLTTYDVEDDLAGRTIRCRECFTPGRVEAPAKKKDKKSLSKPDHDSDPSSAPIERPARQKKAAEKTHPASVMHYRCPFCRSERYPRRPLFAGIVAAAMLTVGILAFLVYWLVFDIAVSSANGRVVNEGLMNDRIVGMIGAVGLCLGGALIRVTAAQRCYCPDCRIRLD